MKQSNNIESRENHQTKIFIAANYCENPVVKNDTNYKHKWGHQNK